MAVDLRKICVVMSISFFFRPKARLQHQAMNSLRPDHGKSTCILTVLLYYLLKIFSMYDGEHNIDQLEVLLHADIISISRRFYENRVSVNNKNDLHN